MKYLKCKSIRMALSIGVMSLLFLTGCDKGFEDMNVNPNAYTEPELNPLFTNSLIRIVGTGTADRNRTNIKFFSGAMQYHATLQNFWYGEKGIVNSQSGNFFETVYTSHLREISVIIDATEGLADKVNQNAIAKIWEIYDIQRVTDAYGDVPYKDAVKGMSDIYKPKYDKQSDIYPWMLEDLEAAINQLDPALTSYGAADVVFGGDVNKWKKFGYSLMLRIGMRMTKVDPTMSKTWVEKAVTGGVFESIADQAVLKHVKDNSNTWNWDARELKRESLPESNKGLGLVKMGKTFMDLLHANNDPRIPIYATLWEGNIDSKQLSVITSTTLPELQKGLPNGYDAGTISQAIPGWTSSMLTSYSEPNTATIANFAAPSIIISYSEIEFLLAEASLRGWVSGDPEDHYHKAIRANMETSYLYPNSSLEPMTITETEISDYLTAHPLTGTDTEKLALIATQFYLAHYMYLDFFEAWSNWRRTGIPALSPINYVLNSTGGVPIRRLMYSTQELSLNTENVNAAIAIQGPDTYLTRVWWDKE
jgi:hypothetical protein